LGQLKRRRIMAERWLTELRRIESVDPPPDLMDRADQYGPVLTDPSPPARSRIGTLIVAVLVAALGSWAALSGLGGIEGAQQRTGNGQEGFPALWPEVSRAEAEKVQEQVDAGDASVQWRTDAASVALRYAHEVLGWTQPIVAVTETNDSDSVIVGLTGPDASCAGTECQDPPTPQSTVRIVLRRLIRSGEGGIWSVTAAGDER
jgi:hypothetical protein